MERGSLRPPECSAVMLLAATLRSLRAFLAVSRKRARGFARLAPMVLAAMFCATVGTIVAEDARPVDDVGPAPALAPGQPPPLPRPGPLSKPRTHDQAGFPLQLMKAATPSASLLTPDLVALGEKLFFESRLSADGTVACATCHDPARAFTDGRPTSVGIEGRAGQRNAPSVLNALFNKTQFLDGRVATLDEQAALPITNPFEMGAVSVDDAVSRIAGDRDYQALFERVFGREPNEQDLLSAIAAYERTLSSFDSPFDHFIAGDQAAISNSAKRGWELFNDKARCNLCHALSEKQRDVSVFTDHDFHNIGVGIRRHNFPELVRRSERELGVGKLRVIDAKAIESEISELGRFLVTQKEKDIAAFKTPDIRNILVTGPYFHDGSMQTLWDVIDHYNKSDDTFDPWIDEDMQPLALTDQEIDDLVAFMASLTSPQYKEQGKRELARQAAVAKVSRPERDTARAFGPKPQRAKAQALESGFR